MLTKNQFKPPRSRHSNGGELAQRGIRIAWGEFSAYNDLHCDDPNDDLPNCIIKRHRKIDERRNIKLTH